MVARYAAYHVIWTVGGEYDVEAADRTKDWNDPTAPTERDRFASYGQLIKSLDGYGHPVTAHPGDAPLVASRRPIQYPSVDLFVFSA